MRLTCKGCYDVDKCVDFHNISGKTWCEVDKQNVKWKREVSEYINQDHVEFDNDLLFVFNKDSDRMIEWKSSISICDFSFMKDLDNTEQKLLLYRMEGISYREISCLMDMNLKQIFLSLQDIYKRLKDFGITRKMLLVVYRKLDNCSEEEIGNELGITHQAVHKYIQKFIDLLNKQKIFCYKS